MAWRFSRFLNALEANLLDTADDPEAIHALIHRVPAHAAVTTAPRTAPPARPHRRPRRVISRERAAQLAQDDERFRREMGDTS